MRIGDDFFEFPVWKATSEKMPRFTLYDPECHAKVLEVVNLGDDDHRLIFNTGGVEVAATLDGVGALKVFIDSWLEDQAYLFGNKN
jgi:hypothetical protein